MWKSMLKINGEPSEASGMTISDYLTEQGYNKKRIVVEINYEIIPKEKYDDIQLEDDDVVEIITFMGGGWYTDTLKYCILIFYKRLEILDRWMIS